MARVLSVGLSPTIQKTISFGTLALDRVNRSSGYRLDASGKAVNAARVLNQLSPGVVACLCPLGADNASLFLDLAASDGLPVEYVAVPGLTRHCYTLLETGTGRATELVVNEPQFAPAPHGTADMPSVSDAWERAAGELFGRFDALLSGIGPDGQAAGRIEAVLLAGSRPAVFPGDLYARLAARAVAAGALVLVDYHGTDLLRTLDLAVPSVIKINEEEFCATFGYPFPADEARLLGDIAAKSAELGNCIVVTRGSRDTLAASAGRTYRQPVTPVEPVNVIGCGDSFAAGLVFSLLDSPDMSAALEKATWCASRNALSLRPGSVAG